MTRSTQLLFRKSVYFLVAASIVLTSVSCTTLKRRIHRGYVEEKKVQQQIADLNAKHAEEVKQIEIKVSFKKDAVIKNQDNQLQTVANSLYGADQAFQFYSPPEPSRVDLIVNNRVKEAAAATGKKATAEAMEIENQRLKKELDEKITSLEELKKKHEIVVTENTKLADKTEEDKKQIKSLQDSIAKLNTEHSDALIVKQNELIQKQSRINDLEKQRADDAEWIRKVKLKVMAVLGLISLLCAAGAIWSPVFKSKFAMVAVVAGAAAALVMYVQPWMILTGAAVAVLGITAKIVLEHKTAHTTATNLVNYIEDQKVSNPSAYNKEKLKDYNGKYVKNADGTIRVVSDPSVERFIEQTLISSQKL